MDTRLVKTSADQRLMEWAQLVAERRNSELTRKEVVCPARDYGAEIPLLAKAGI